MMDNIKHFIENALFEDLGRGDLFQRLLDKDFRAKAYIIAKDEGVFSGKVYVDELCKICNIDLKWHIDDKGHFKSQDKLVELEADYTLLLKIERILLNIIQHSSGIATNTASYMEILGDLEISVLDTRKTRPLLRDFEKYSVRNGGAKNHRMGLDDTLMLKDTHFKYIDTKDLKSMILKARKQIPWTAKIELEADSVEFAKVALACGADIVMCDNMQSHEIKEVVEFRNEFYPHVLLEASGMINKNTILEYAKTGVDAISIGSLIHQAVWVDMSMKMS